MPTLVERLGLSGNPFEHYTAETEPDISKYAVRPPYLRSIVDRAAACSSFILFGDRGAGKSATRITAYNELWQAKAGATKGVPLVANFTDFTGIHEKIRRGTLVDLDLVRGTAFAVVEQLLVWLSSLDDADRAVYTEGLDGEEKAIVIALVQGFYLNISENDRQMATAEALRLLNSTWKTKSAVWLSQRWGALSKLVASIADIFSKSAVDADSDLSRSAEAVLNSLQESGAATPRAILQKLVEFAKIFGFSGVCVLVDKLDETPSTSNSAESTAKLIHPLLSHIQLLEVVDFSWLIFVWSKVKDHFDGADYAVRLDKLANANITWDEKALREMVESRIRFFSNNALGFADIFCHDVNVDTEFRSLSKLAIYSPRQLIKLMDVIFREHDNRGEAGTAKIDVESLQAGQDKFATETVSADYEDKVLQQVFRVGRVAFVNRDVQYVFKMGGQSARNRIKVWEDSGLVQQTGTTAPSELGGKPAYTYEVLDSRVQRIIERKLVPIVGEEVPEGEVEIMTDDEGPEA